MRKEARHTQRRDRASGVPLEILEHIPPKPESAYFLLVLSPIKEELANRIKGEGIVAVELEAVVDPSIIGGFVCEADSRRLDASVSSRLREARKLLVEQNRKLV